MAGSNFWKCVSAGAAALIAGAVYNGRRKRPIADATPVHQPPKPVSQLISENKEKKQEKTRKKNAQPKAERTSVKRREEERKLQAQQRARMKNLNRK